MNTPPLLPVRIVQNRHARLDAFDDAWFRFLKRSGVSAIFLQNAPFDPMRTGNVGQFFHHFHLISLFDIARSHRRQDYQDYINEVCRRAAAFGIEVWLDCWEPRLPGAGKAPSSRGHAAGCLYTTVRASTGGRRHGTGRVSRQYQVSKHAGTVSCVGTATGT